MQIYCFEAEEMTNRARILVQKLDPAAVCDTSLATHLLVAFGPLLVTFGPSSASLTLRRRPTISYPSSILHKP
jgi:hypothetical protein